MHSAIIAFMVEEGWRLGLPLAVLVEGRCDEKLYIEEAMIGYVIVADHDRLVFRPRLADDKNLLTVNLPACKEMCMHGRKNWEISLENERTLRISQSVRIIRRVGYWAEDLARQKAFMQMPGYGQMQ